jgi:hypothetical protein
VDRSWLIHDVYSGAEGEAGPAEAEAEARDPRSVSVSRISGELVWTTMSSQSSQP